MKECTRRVLRHVLTNRCAKVLNWKGKGSKRALSQMTLHKVITSKFQLTSCAMLYAYDVKNMTLTFCHFHSTLQLLMLI